MKPNERKCYMIVETREYPQGDGSLLAHISDTGHVLFEVHSWVPIWANPPQAGVSAAGLRQLADLAEAASRKPDEGKTT